MKKWVLITGIIILIIAGVLVVHRVKNNMPKVLPNGTVVYDFTKQRQLRASKILYEYILEEYAEDSKRYHDIDYIKTHYGNIKKYAETEFLITPKRVHAFEYDLNDDGKNEIIGFVSASAYWGTAGFSLFILEKKDNQYVDISYLLNFEPQINFYILPKKTHNYKNIILSGSIAHNFMHMLIKFNGEYYFSEEQNELFIKYLKKFSNYDVSEITGEIEY